MREGDSDGGDDDVLVNPLSILENIPIMIPPHKSPGTNPLISGGCLVKLTWGIGGAAVAAIKGNP